MKNKLFRRAAVLTAALFSLTCMSVTAYAQSDEPAEETTPPAATETVAKPFTPDGTGTVVDNATDEDGKEFFTITTPSENVFYLVIDRQRTEENVYFLNAVTEKDLLALAEADPEPEVKEPVTAHIYPSPAKAVSEENCPLTVPIRSNPALQKADTEWNTEYQIPFPSPSCGQNRNARRTAPTASIINAPRTMNLVCRTIPPTCGAEIDSCMTHRCLNPILLPANIDIAIAIVITPRPPICININITP